MHRSSHAMLMGLIAVAAFAAAGNEVRAEDYQARSWAASCAACHGTNGQGGHAVPGLAGRSRAELYAVLQEFKADRVKTATIMHQHAKGYSDVQLERIADYFSRQKR
jgi:cytochrome subunit of sulfide dehydrogenase